MYLISLVLGEVFFATYTAAAVMNMEKILALEISNCALFCLFSAIQPPNSQWNRGEAASDLIMIKDLPLCSVSLPYDFGG